jgi:hypothetical protein
MPRGLLLDTSVLEQEFAASNELVRSLGAKAAECRRRQNQLLRRAESQRRLALDVAFVLYVVCQASEALALMYLSQRSADLLLKDEEQRREYLECRFLSTDVEALSSIQDGHGAGISKMAFVEATRFRKEALVYDWVRKQNVEQGIAPPSHLVVNFRRQNSQSHSPECSTTTKGGVRAGELKWVQRFRKRWGLRLGRVPVGEAVPLVKLQAKVHWAGKTSCAQGNQSGTSG